MERGIATEGSNLCGMAAMIDWAEQDLVDNRAGGTALSNWDSLAQQCDRSVRLNLLQYSSLTEPCL